MQTCSLFWSGIFLNDVQKSLPAVQDLELLQFQAPGEAPVMFETSGSAPLHMHKVIGEDLAAHMSEQLSAL